VASGKSRSREPVVRSQKKSSDATGNEWGNRKAPVIGIDTAGNQLYSLNC
jgi:hypothetical protein